MVIKTPLPQRPSLLQTTGVRCQFPFEQTDKINNISVLQKQVNVVRHDAPCKEKGLSLAGQVTEQLHEPICEFRVESKPGVFFMCRDGDGECITLLVAIR